MLSRRFFRCFSRKDYESNETINQKNICCSRLKKSWNVSREKKKINFYLDKSLDIPFKSKYTIDPTKITFIQHLFEDDTRLILKYEYVDTDGNEPKIVVAKPFKYDITKMRHFQNELSIFRVIKENEIENSNLNLAEFVGFMRGNFLYRDLPYFGTLFIKWYNFGNLWDFSSGRSEPLNILLCFAEQIANGSLYINYVPILY